MDVSGLASGKGFFFLLLNASIVWAVVSGVLLYLLRFKSLLIALILAPLVIVPAFRSIGGVSELLGYYTTSLLYGFPGIIIGVLYVDYARIKKHFKRASKLAFVARGGVAFSAVYIISYFGREIIFNNPLVRLALDFIEGGDQAQNLVSSVDKDGVTTAVITIVICSAFLAFNRFRQDSLLQKEAKERVLKEATEKIKLTDITTKNQNNHE